MDQKLINMTRINSTNGTAREHKRQSFFDVTIITMKTKSCRGLRMSSFVERKTHAGVGESFTYCLPKICRYGNEAKPGHKWNIWKKRVILLLN